MRIILPKTDPSNQDSPPLFFLVGPIRGGGDWQKTACEELLKQMKGMEFDVAVPCRWKSDHPLASYFYNGKESGRQLVWERWYLELAGGLRNKGCIIAWLPCESKEFPRDDGQPYARDTYGELGEWRGRMIHNPRERFVLGGESLFPGFDVIQRNFAMALETGKGFFPLPDTLEETISRGVARVK